MVPRSAISGYDAETERWTLRLGCWGVLDRRQLPVGPLTLRSKRVNHAIKQGTRTACPVGLRSRGPASGERHAAVNFASHPVPAKTNLLGSTGCGETGCVWEAMRPRGWAWPNPQSGQRLPLIPYNLDARFQH
jgi:hypothetical protein